MKRICLCALVFLFSFCSFVHADTIVEDSKIREVTVYPGSARVVRELKVDLKQGEHTIIFQDIIPRIDQNSLSVSGQGTATVKIFGATFKEEFLKESSNQRVNELEAKIEEIQDKINFERQKEYILKERKEFLTSIKLYAGNQIPKELVTKMPSTESLGDVYQFVSNGLTDVESEKEKIRLMTRDLFKEKKALQNEFRQIQNTSSRTKRSVAVEISCLKSGFLNLEIAYHLSGAYWRPVYDARAELNKKEVELAIYAMVKQTTGEDWSDVDLTLSTSQPSVGGRMPYVAPWILRPQQIARPSTRGRRNLKMEAKSVGSQHEAFSDQVVMRLMDDEFVLAKNKEAQVDYGRVNQKGLALEYVLSKPVSIFSDGTEQKLPVSVQNLDVDFEYSTFPKVRASAFLGSRVQNSDQLKLLAGDVNLFLDGDYVGKSSIDSIMPGEDFDLYLGVDENIKVKREMISKEVDKTFFAGIESSSKKVTYKYKLTVENYTSKTAKIKLFEAMPTPEDDRIKVKVFDISVKPEEKNWKDRAGIWLWKFDLKPKQKKEIFYSFIVEHPRKIVVDGI